MLRVGQNHTFIGIYSVCKVFLQYFWWGNHHTIGHIRCVYTVLANPMHAACAGLSYGSACGAVCGMEGSGGLAACCTLLRVLV
jgi:hypothetical protein